MLHTPFHTAQSFLALIDSRLCIVECSVEGVIISANQRFLSAAAREPGDVLGRAFGDLCRTRKERSAFTLDSQVASENGGRYELLVAGGDPADFWALAVPVQDSSGEVSKIMYAGFVDDPDYQNMHGDISSALLVEAVHRSLLVAEYTAHGMLTSANDHMLSVLGFSFDEMKNKPLSDMLAPSVGDAIAEAWRHICSGHVHSELHNWRTAHGTSVWLDSVFTPVVDERGKIRKIIQFASDVTERTAREKRQFSLARLLASVTDSTRNAVSITDSAGKVVYVNQSFITMTGYGRSDILGKTPGRIFGPLEIRHRQEMGELLNRKESSAFEAMLYGKNGQRLFVSALAKRIQTPEGKVFIATVMTDITDAKLHEQLHNRALEALADETPCPEVISMLCVEVERMIPDMFASVTGVTRNGGLYTIAAPSSPVRTDWNSLPDGERGTPTARTIRTGEVTVEKNLAASAYPDAVKEIFKGAGIAACCATPIMSGSNTIIGAVTFYFPEQREPDTLHTRVADVVSRLCTLAMERDESRRTMRILKFYDPVTKLPMRDLLKANIEQMLGSKNASPLAVLAVHIDRFDRFNKAYGHDAGNKILRTVAARIQRNRQDDILFGRGHSDECLVIVPGTTPDKALVMAKLLQKQISEPCRINGVDIFLEASVGISLYPENSTNVDELIDQAGMALAQKNGNADIRFFSKEMDTLASRNLSLEASLRAAILREELHLHYQPQINLKTGGLYGVEALCRWTDPENGPVSPVRFIPLAEESGLIEQLSEWVWRSACTQLGNWRKEGMAVPAVSVNLSSSNFQDEELPVRIREHIKQEGLAPRDVVLELTESVLLDSTPATQRTIDKAHAMGFALSLDDFGTGYSSLSYLKDLPISEIKLDRSFVKDIDTDETSCRISQAIRYIGTSLKLSVLAEGIETPIQCERIRKLRYHAAQGFLFSKPMPPDELASWMRQ